MRNAGYSSSAVCGAGFPVLTEEATFSAFAAEDDDIEITQKDLQLIDSFAFLNKAERRLVLEDTDFMLRKEMQALAK